MNPRVGRLPVWKEIPVPFFVTYQTDGTPDFKVINEDNRLRCAVDRLCWVCGEGLTYWITFVGGPASIANRLFVDGPMHPECAADAMAICPFLLGNMGYAKKFDLSKHGSDVQVKMQRLTEPRQNEPPNTVALYLTRGFSVASRGDQWGDEGPWFFFADTAKSVTWQKR